MQGLTSFLPPLFAWPALLVNYGKSSRPDLCNRDPVERCVPTYSDFGLDRLELVLELGKLATARHQARQLFEVERRLLEAAEALAPVQNHEPVTDRIGMVGIVGDEDDGDAAISRLEDVLENNAG